MNDQICFCGTAPGYIHTRDCPYPCYWGADSEYAKWQAARARLTQQATIVGALGRALDRSPGLLAALDDSGVDED
jgi:hypothetical protein